MYFEKRKLMFSPEKKYAVNGKIEILSHKMVTSGKFVTNKKVKY